MKPALRIPSRLSESLHRQLNSYALAVGAAGAGVLALSHPAHAKIVYTPAKISILENGGLVELDLNHDGIDDFQFSNRYQSWTRRGYQLHASMLYVAPAQTLNRAIRVVARDTEWAAALPKGYRVDFNDPFQPGHNQIQMLRAGFNQFSSQSTYGPWLNKHAMYLGLEFFIKGKVHFGWARLNVSVNSGDCKNICATITGYAYETVAEKTIIAGKIRGEDDVTGVGPVDAPSFETQAATLGRLARGAQGLSDWRKTAPQ
jgi:hypothetical protein